MQINRQKYNKCLKIIKNSIKNKKIYFNKIYMVIAFRKTIGSNWIYRDAIFIGTL